MLRLRAVPWQFRLFVIDKKTKTLVGLNLFARGWKLKDQKKMFEVHVNSITNANSPLSVFKSVQI